ncbi:hypothetical protein [Pseudolactococcus hodotermopsidis]|nr:hypothetical protein [Lactococcus hodotermopsidis]
MKEIYKLVSEISLSNVLKRNTFQKVFEILYGVGEKGISQNLKVYILALISWLVSLVSSVNWIIFPISSTIITFTLLTVYCKRPRFLNDVAYTLATFLLCQNTVIFYLASIKISENVILNRSVTLFYVLICYFLSFYIVKIKLLDSIQESYFADSKNIIKSNAIKNIKLLSSILVLFVILLISAMQLYRLNKWWIKSYNLEFLAGLNGTILGNIFSIISVFIAIIIVLLFTMIPTLFLNSDIIVNGLLLRKYSEEFRKEYDFTKEEWYGEK